MLTKTQEQILIFLLDRQDDNFTIRSLARSLKKSYPLVYNNLLSLEERGIITKKDIPPGKVITLSENIPKNVIINIEMKKRDNFLKRHPEIKLMLEDTLKSVKNPFFILLIFGSYAKGKQTKKSDLDILIIVKEKNDIKEIERAVNKTITKAKKSLIFIEIKDFKEMIKNDKEFNVGNEAKKNHVILYGAEQFYQLIRK